MFWLPVLLSFVLLAHAASRTSPPSGAVVVKPGTTTSGQYTTLSAALAALPNDSTARSIFLYPGTYQEQVLINRSGPLTIFGYTSDTMDFTKNQVVISHALSAGQAGSDDASGTLRIKSNNVKLYNIDVRNDFGVASTNGQAIAVSAYGDKFGAYACRFFSYQDTLLTNQGNQVYLKTYIEGGVDYIFGQRSRVWFEGNTIASKGAGCITANGRDSDSNVSLYVFNKNSIIASANAYSNVTGKAFLGRPWRDYARVVFLNSDISLQLNKAIWSQWSSATPNTDHILFAEYNSQGAGVSGAQRPSFATVLTASQAAAYTISTTVGSDFATWVDTSYLT